MKRVLSEIIWLSGCFAVSFITSFGVAAIITARRAEREEAEMETSIAHLTPEMQDKVRGQWRMRNWIKR